MANDQQHSQQWTALLTATVQWRGLNRAGRQVERGQQWYGPGGGGVPNYLKNQDNKMATVFANPAIHASSIHFK